MVNCFLNLQSLPHPDSFSFGILGHKLFHNCLLKLEIKWRSSPSLTISLYCDSWFTCLYLPLDLPEKGMAPHSGILTCRVPWTEKSGGLQSMGSQRVGHNRATKTDRQTDTHTHHFLVWDLILVNIASFTTSTLSDSYWTYYRLTTHSINDC